MKILIIQENGRHEKNRHFRECFCMKRALELLNQTVDIWGLGHENFTEIPDWELYDLILNFENYDSTNWVPSLSHTRNPKKFLWSIDAHCVGVEKFMAAFTNGNYDLVLQATLDYVNEESVWFPNCFDDSLFYPSLEKKHFLGFCGSLLNRKQILDFLTEKYGLKQDIWVIGNDMVDVVSSYHIHFNINLANDINYRSFETLACNTMLLTNYNPQYEKLGFKDGINCMMYNDIEELRNKIELCKSNPTLVRNISDAGFDLAKQNTYKERAKKIIELYKGLG